MSQIVYDGKGRWRNKTVAFRMSSAEDMQLEKAVALSGLIKQDYIISRLAERDVIVQGNPRVYKALRNEMRAILAQLERLHHCSDADDEFLSIIRLVMEIVKGMEACEHGGK